MLVVAHVEKVSANSKEDQSKNSIITIRMLQNCVYELKCVHIVQMYFVFECRNFTNSFNKFIFIEGQSILYLPFVLCLKSFHPRLYLRHLCDWEKKEKPRLNKDAEFYSFEFSWTYPNFFRVISVLWIFYKISLFHLIHNTKMHK